MVESDIAQRKGNIIEDIINSPDRHSPPPGSGISSNFLAPTADPSAIMTPAIIANEDLPRSIASSSMANTEAMPGTSHQSLTSSINNKSITPSKYAYTGLVNQAMTCYLNSLIQTLFMTPEFRNAIYNWEFSSPTGDETKSIPYQLQKLFLLLQTSDKAALETKDLTRSFGWDSSHAWDQHDVQELCRVMFDALEYAWRKTPRSTIINNLYQGSIKDYVKCLECDNESARDDVFLDLPLAVRPFGSQHAFSSVDEALKAFVKAELLESSNQYSCGTCAKKCDAHKGLKITRFPYLLTIQLKRFDFDYSTMHRIKLNDRMTFPDVLNLNAFIEKKPASESYVAPTPATNGSSGDAAAASSFAAQPRQRGAEAAPAATVVKRVESDDEGICLENNGTAGVGSSTHSPAESDLSYDYDANLVNEKIDPSVVASYLAQGPYVYELFSIMVHSGSANGGHYYAYIKSLDSQIWYCFNDQVVNRASVEDIRKTYGGSPSQFSYSYSSSTNAYMLMYRKIDRSRNEKFVLNDKLPNHLFEMLQRLDLEEQEQRREEEYQRSLTTYEVYYYHPKTGELSPKNEIQIAKKVPMFNLVEKCYKQFELAKFDIPIDQVRLVKFNVKGVLEGSLGDDSSMDYLQHPVVDVLGNMFMSDLLLEIRPKHLKSFQIYNKENNALTFHIRTVLLIDKNNGNENDPTDDTNLAKKCKIGPYFPFYVDPFDSIGSIRNSIAEYVQWEHLKVYLLLDRYNDRLRLLDKNNGRIKEEVGGHIIPVSVYVIGMDPEDPKRPEHYQAALRAIERHKHLIQFKLILPSKRECREHFFGASGMASADVDSLDDGDEEEVVDEKIEEPQAPPYEQVVALKNHSPPPVPPYSAAVAMAIPPAPPVLSRRRPCIIDTVDASGQPMVCSLASPKPPAPPRDDDASMDATTPSPRVSPTNQGAGDDDDDSEIARPASVSCDDSSPAPMDPASPPPRGDGFSNTANWLEHNASYGEPDPDPDPLPHMSPPEFGYGLYATPPPPLVTDDEADANDDAVVPEAHAIVDGRVAPSNSPVVATAAGIGVVAPPPPPPHEQSPSPPAYDGLDRECSFTISEQNDAQRVCDVECDGRLSANDFKVKVAEFIGAKPDQFKFYKIFTSNEYQWSHERDLIRDIKNAQSLRVKLGRVVKTHENLIKFMLFDHREFQVNKHLFDFILSRNTSLSRMKNRLKILLARKNNIDVTPDRIRIREMGSNQVEWVNSNETLHNKSYWTSHELYIQILQNPDPENASDFMLLFVRRWMPSTATYGGLDELMLPAKCSYGQLFTKIGELCHLDPSNIEVASTQGDCAAFPFECSKLKMLEDLTFHALPFTDSYLNDSIGQSPLHCSCGHVVYYRDKNEKQKKISDDERKEMQIRDSVRLQKRSSFTFRKERALKIYTEMSSSIIEDDPMDT